MSPKINIKALLLSIVLTVVITVTSAFVFGNLQQEATVEFREIVDAPFDVLQSTFTYSGNQRVDFTIELQNIASSPQTAYVEVQALGMSGDIITYDANGSDMIRYATSTQLLAGEIWMKEFVFQNPSLVTELNVFLILVRDASNATIQSLYFSGGGTSVPPTIFLGYVSESVSGPKYPNYRFYDTAWSSELQISETLTDGQAVHTAFNPVITDERVMLVINSQNYVYGFKSRGFGWDIENLGRAWANMPAFTDRPFDIAFEGVSGDGIVVINNEDADGSHDLQYKILSGTSPRTWSSTMYIGDDESGVNNEFRQVMMTGKPGEDEVALLGIRDDGHAFCWTWDGSAWSAPHEITDASNFVSEPDYETGELEYEFSSGELMVTVGAGTSIRWATYDSTLPANQWSTTQSMAMDPATSRLGDIYWVVLRNHMYSGSDKLMLLSLDSNHKLYARYWDGSSWATATELDDKLRTDLKRCFDGDWEHTLNGKFLVAGADHPVTLLSYKTWNGISWSPAPSGTWTTYGSSVGLQDWVQVRGNPAATTPLMVISTVNNLPEADLYVTEWDGSNMGTQNFFSQNIENPYESFEVAYAYP
ncbi:MAG: hypothetical protein NWE89_01715 [Candidatus Bathyarchaeota archaeon]|nr:hypothetical protein [Candidatus Bathyarchaeota archaeon]